MKSYKNTSLERKNRKFKNLAVVFMADQWLFKFTSQKEKACIVESNDLKSEMFSGFVEGTYPGQ